MSHSILFLVTFAPVFIAAILCLVADMFDRPRTVVLLAAGLLAVSGVVALYGAWSVRPGPAVQAFTSGGFASAVPGVAFIALSFALLSALRVRRPGQVSGLAVLAACGGALAAVSTDLVSMLIGIEMAAVCAYALVASGESKGAGEAGLKYFVQGSVATGLFVLGLAVLAGVFAPDGALDTIVRAITAKPELAPLAVIGSLALVAAVSFKSGAAPFHSWAPDAYQTAPSPAAAFMAGALKLAMVAVLASVAGRLAPAGATVETPYGVLMLPVFSAIGALGLLSIIVGSTVALTTGSYRRMLGYAGVAQVGYALIALGSLNPSAALAFAATYALATTAAFLGAEAFGRLEPGWDGSVAGLAGAGRRYPIVSGAVAVSLVSLAGIPPLLGFWGKLQAFGAALSASAAFGERGLTAYAMWLAGLTVVGVVGSVISLGYYGNVIRTLFFVPSTDRTDKDEEGRGAGGAAFAVVALAFLLFALGIAPLFVGISASVRGFLLG